MGTRRLNLDPLNEKENVYVEKGAKLDYKRFAILVLNISELTCCLV